MLALKLFSTLVVVYFSAVRGFSLLPSYINLLEIVQNSFSFDPLRLTSLDLAVVAPKVVASSDLTTDLIQSSQELLNKYPDAVRSTSAVWGEIVSKSSEPLEGFSKIWVSSPLKKDIDTISMESTSKVTADFFGYVSDRAGPNLAKLGLGGGEDSVASKIAAKWSGEGSKFLNANPDLKLTTSQYFSKALNGLNEALSAPVPGLPSLPTTSISISDIDGIPIPSISIPEINVPDLGDIGEATSRGADKFNSQLAVKGAELSRNTEAGLSATSKAIDTITTDLKTNLPSVLEAAQKAPDAIKANLESKIDEFNKVQSTVEIPKENIFTKGWANLSQGSKYKPPANIIDKEKILADFSRGSADFQKSLQSARVPEIDASQFTQQVQQAVDAVNEVVDSAKVK
jgi:hypothetical protein